ncbi:serine/threonine-protein kinase [Streptomyces sp. NPDC012751]|uniref:serine/threonine-protein kinase n=1 Tax=Streptomyces sp. NPDC012751 TaxID=3364846 RepID=UPI0036A8997F
MRPLERIGRHRLERPLGSGAFATVWLAHDPELQAPVAVKVLAENWAHRLDVRERFLAEARLLRRAASSRVVQVYDIGELPDSRPYFVMEYAGGGTLAELLTDGPLPVSDALALTAEAARAAAALHEAGIVHRDIKPTNVLLHTAPDGTRRVLLADLGLAKSLAQGSVLTLAAGSAGYRPPEQAQPGAGIDERADVYSLGAVGYELLTGTVPGPPGQVVPPRRLRPELGGDVARALLRALEPERARRWPGAAEFARELDRLAAAPAARPERRPAGWRGRPGTVALALAAVLAASAAAVTATVVPHRGGTGDDGVRVADTTGRITLRVPAGWARELRDSGWDPRALGLAAGHEPGLLVADDLSRWSDPRAPVNGVFAGAAAHGGVTAKVRALTHAGCRYAGARAFSDTGRHALVRSWRGCPDGGSVTEAALLPVGGTGPEVYVQERRHDGADVMDGVLRSLRVA